jgi:hypothetical protein
MDSSKNTKRSPLSRLSSCWPRLISPISWWHCFNLLYNPSFSTGESKTSFFKVPRRISVKRLKFLSLHVFLLVLVGFWCYFYYMITFDAGQYLKLLSSISSNRSNKTEGRSTFDQLVWRTALKTLFISIDFGLINAYGIVLASFWRERLFKRFSNLIFR